MARQLSANDIINRVAIEVGLLPVTDPVGSANEGFRQLKGLLDSAGQELVELFQWQVLQKTHSFTTDGIASTYDLPDDFCYMIDQTGWDLANEIPLGGPLSPQVWSYLYGRNLSGQTIYASFRLLDNKMDLFPQPPPAGIDVRFEYVGRNWVMEVGGGTYYDYVDAGSNIVLFEPIVVIKFLKCKFLEAKGLDATAARNEFENMFDSRSGKDMSAPVLSVGGCTSRFPYINPYFNVGDTGYGA